MSMDKLRRRSQKGFTILELVVVIIVIIVLLVVVFATRAGVAEKERNTERQRDIAELRGSVEAYYARNDSYPTLDELNSDDWRRANIKSLESEVLRDPAYTNNDFKLAGKPAEKIYSYYVTSADGNACDNKKTPCTQYTLVATLEGGGRYIKNNLN